MEYLVLFGCFAVFMVAVRVLNAYWQRKHRRTRPPRHQGEPQSQRRRVYEDPPPANDNADRYSGWP
ncbi:hypothetical protein [uncultured Arthrobacter sp.]|uniref:hypothetical protein n=1 Tax=uncultured Arthrobacter sp. TaxID=114050 RepID=UPI0028D13E29|nr:hypothetical protein [uncultured Arthrobacter sp.]